jgi:tRNA(fMet)-specific endonuclease VapC
VENEIVLLDTSVLIDYYRKKDKSKSYFFKLTDLYNSFAISSITYFEIYTGVSTDDQKLVWDAFFQEIIILPFDTETAKTAANLNVKLKRARKQIEMADLFIAATAISNNMACATLNKKHFERIENLNLVAQL